MRMGRCGDSHRLGAADDGGLAALHSMIRPRGSISKVARARLVSRCGSEHEHGAAAVGTAAGNGKVQLPLRTHRAGRASVTLYRVLRHLSLGCPAAGVTPAMAATASREVPGAESGLSGGCGLSQGPVMHHAGIKGCPS